MKRLFLILVFISPFFLKGQSGCGDPEAPNYYCNTAFDCILVGVDSLNIPIWNLPLEFSDSYYRIKFYQILDQ